MKKFSLLILMVSFLVNINCFAQEEEAFTLTDIQLKDISSLAEVTNNLQAAQEIVNQEKSKLTSISELNLEDIKFVLSIIQPITLSPNVLESLEEEQVNNFADEFWKARSEGITKLFEDNNISNEKDAEKKFKWLLTNELKKILLKESLTFQGANFTLDELKIEKGGVITYEILLKLLNNNIDDKLWDKKIAFLLKNSTLNLFK